MSKKRRNSNQPLLSAGSKQGLDLYQGGYDYECLCLQRPRQRLTYQSHTDTEQGGGQRRQQEASGSIDNLNTHTHTHMHSKCRLKHMLSHTPNHITILIFKWSQALKNRLYKKFASLNTAKLYTLLL